MMPGRPEPRPVSAWSLQHRAWGNWRLGPGAGHRVEGLDSPR